MEGVFVFLFFYFFFFGGGGVGGWGGVECFSDSGRRVSANPLLRAWGLYKGLGFT